MKNFAIIGAAGSIAPLHLKAVYDTGNRLIAALDPHDAVGILDQYSFDARFFRRAEPFDEYLETLRHGAEDDRIHYVSICSPNDLHSAHIRMALRIGADAICEKPLVINPWDLDVLHMLEKETGRKVNAILQLRVHPTLLGVKRSLEQKRDSTNHEVVLTYIAGHGAWFPHSWAGSAERSGGLSISVGIQFFDLLMWLFGGMEKCEVHLNETDKMSGFLQLKRANVRWFLSVNPRDLPFPAQPGTKVNYRSITIDGHELEFTEGFSDLHTRVYEKILDHKGFGIEEARPSIETAYRIRSSSLSTVKDAVHPYLLGGWRTPTEDELLKVDVV